MPAALRSIASLSRQGFYGKEHAEWGVLADRYAQVWEDETLQFFEVCLHKNRPRLVDGIFQGKKKRKKTDR
jgi:hypothetical protein